jgi:hypothetical protein
MNNYQIILTVLILTIFIIIISNLMVRFKIYKLKQKYYTDRIKANYEEMKKISLRINKLKANE